VAPAEQLPQSSAQVLQSSLAWQIPSPQDDAEQLPQSASQEVQFSLA
jgi:hypothetical protein